jgi:hypothetical protein
MIIAIAIFASTIAQTASPPAPAATASPAADLQIAAALLAAPDEYRENATVLGYDEQGKLGTLRKGSNDLVCLGDDPKTPGLHVACYHKDLEPFMARGRELAAQGTAGRARNDTRWKEVEAGTLPMPREPRTLYVLTAKDYDSASGKALDPYLRWVIYVPFATAASTGLPTKPIEHGPWLMDPGTAGAHIMISPPRPKSP